MDSYRATERLGDHLAASYSAGDVVATTWLNHFTAASFLGVKPSVRDALDLVAIDGLFLRRLLGGGAPRTSADLLLPQLLPRLRQARVAFIGGTASTAAAAPAALRGLLDESSRVVASMDGYDALPRPDSLDEWIAGCRPNVVILGLGAGLQDQYAARIAATLDSGLVFTCGGFVDQLIGGDYYPPWAYATRLNWAVRLWREPRRLYRRYTIDAVQALRLAPRIRAVLDATPGYRRYVAVLT
jgi:UDP-N-acetyl-D-mannosaminuronic acid transferase (WecB/TagA/CpsF family)